MIGMLKSGVAALAFTVVMSVQALAGTPFFEVVKGNAPAIEIGTAEFAAIGEKEISTTVLTMGDEKHTVHGILGRDLLDYVKAEGTTISLVALDGYTMDVPVEDLRKYDTLVATAIDGKPLSVRDKGPAWLIYPVSDHKELSDTIYESRSVWQIKTIKVQ